ncbi:MAG TPA: heterodisulfide reductase-related iron-sulfur binding cluster, partial [Dehalococcoidales bacterium]
MVPQREIFWNIQFSPVLYGIATVVVLIMVYAFYRRYNTWHLGKTDNRIKGNLRQRWKAFFSWGVVDGIFQRKFIGTADNLGRRRFLLRDLRPRELYAGLAHFFIYGGFIVLLIGTAMDVVSHYGYDFLKGNVYLGHTLAMDIAGLAVIIGIILAAVRRYVLKPDRLDNKTEDLVALTALLVIVVTGFLIQAVRLAYSAPPWAWWSPAGYIVSFAFGGVSQDSLLVIHRSLWWFHVVLAEGAMAYVALSWNRLWHIVVSPLNIFWRDLGVRGAMVPIDLETAQSFGVSKVEDFTWKNLLDLDACTRCGRCTDNCPAHLSGKPLNPKMVLQNLKADLVQKAPALLAARSKAVKSVAAGPYTTSNNPISEPTAPAEDSRPMAGGVIETDAIWNCTTCFACQEVCPVWAEPMIKLSEMRRHLVLEQAAIPETAEGALRSIEDRGHPWRGTTLTRTDWFAGSGIKTLAEDADVDVLYWVGCTEALEDRSFKVSQAIGKLLKTAGVKFAVLGNEETCCGDPARRLGNEYLYQTLAQKNIETFKRYNVKKIVTGCAHCYNTIKNEYPQFGGNFEVVHHTDFILQLLQEGRLKVSKGPNVKVTYHDPCYLGRYNNIFESPRRIFEYIPDLSLVEMQRNYERSFCCGAGGGHMWLEEQKVGERINVMRTQQALQTRAGLVATACPYCLQMFQDGIKTAAAEES